MKINYKTIPYKPNTVGWYLNKIEDIDVKKKALKNTSPDKLHLYCLSQHSALNVAFIWKDTLEGGIYWSSIYLKMGQK